MEIRYKNNKLRKLLEDGVALQRTYGKRQSLEIVARLGELLAAETLADIFMIPQARAHWAVGNWNGHLSLDIAHPYRIYLFPENGDRANPRTITIVCVIKIHDPH